MRGQYLYGGLITCIMATLCAGTISLILKGDPQVNWSVPALLVLFWMGVIYLIDHNSRYWEAQERETPSAE